MTNLKLVATAAALGALMSNAAIAQTAPLAPAQATAALAALDDEYHALATYRVVMEKFGAVRPFSNIIKAEQRHIDAVAAVLKDSNQTVPGNPYLSGEKPRPVAPATLKEACAIGVQAEIANAALYDDKLLPVAQGNARLVTVFTALRDASENNHLPAFRRCAM